MAANFLGVRTTRSDGLMGEVGAFIWVYLPRMLAPRASVQPKIDSQRDLALFCKHTLTGLPWNHRQPQIAPTSNPAPVQPS